MSDEQPPPTEVGSTATRKAGDAAAGDAARAAPRPRVVSSADDLARALGGLPPVPDAPEQEPAAGPDFGLLEVSATSKKLAPNVFPEKRVAQPSPTPPPTHPTRTQALTFLHTHTMTLKIRST